MAEDTDPATRLRDAPVAALEDLLRSVPRLVERTAHQAALVRSAAGSLWCLGSRPSHPPAPPEPSGTDAMTAEPVSVLDLFDVDDPSDGTQLSAEDLRAVLAYEQVHRRRQTILNRVSQLLEA